jgi:hypothetical protein
MLTERFHRFQIAWGILAPVFCFAGTGRAAESIGAVTVKNNLKDDLVIAVWYTKLQDADLGAMGWVNVKPGASAKLEYTGSDTEIYLHLESKGKELRQKERDDDKDFPATDSRFEVRQHGDSNVQVWKWGEKLENSTTVDLKKKERPDSWDVRRFFNATNARKVNVNP